MPFTTPLLVALVHAAAVHTRTSYPLTVLHQLSLDTAFQLNVGVVSLVGVVTLNHQGTFGPLVSIPVILSLLA